MNADGTGQTNLSNNAAEDSEPSWSPDGSKIAFASEKDGNSQIFIMNPDGTGQENLSNNAESDDQPDWGTHPDQALPDTTDPEVSISATDKQDKEIADGGTTKWKEITFEFEVTDDTGVTSTECSLDGSAFKPCESPITYTSSANRGKLDKGDHTFTVRASDEAGNVGEETFTWTIESPGQSKN